LAGKKKKTFWNTMFNMAQFPRLRTALQRGVARLGMEDATFVDDAGRRHVKSEVLKNIEVLWACLHLSKSEVQRVGTTESTPLPQLCIVRATTNVNIINSEDFPISLDELEQHVLRCAYVMKQFHVGTSRPSRAHEAASADGWGFFNDALG
jgi:hypothetical protein